MEEGSPVIAEPPFELDSLATFGFDDSLEPSFGVEQEAARKATVSEAARRRGCSRAIVSRSVRNQIAIGPIGDGPDFRDGDKRSVDEHDVEASPHVEGTFHMRPIERDLRRHGADVVAAGKRRESRSQGAKR